MSLSAWLQERFLPILKIRNVEHKEIFAAITLNHCQHSIIVVVVIIIIYQWFWWQKLFHYVLFTITHNSFSVPLCSLLGILKQSNTIDDIYPDKVAKIITGQEDKKQLMLSVQKSPKIRSQLIKTCIVRAQTSQSFCSHREEIKSVHSK